MTDTITTVLKFGGSVLRDEKDLPLAVHEIYQHWRRGEKVLAVVSAFGGTTDLLLERARSFDSDPDPQALATLLLTGEATSAAMLGLALKRAGIPAKILTPEQVGVLTEGDPLDAQPVSANVGKLHEELSKAVVVISGFAGIDEHGDLTLLGRGGTDYTALFLAEKLNGRCILLKDVDGMYESNPAEAANPPRKFSHANYQKTIEVAGELVQPKAVRFAEQHDLLFEIKAMRGVGGTTIGAGDNVLHEQPPSHEAKKLRVALLGCGVVGGGVYERLAALSDKFEIVGVVNLDPQKARAAGVEESHRFGDAKQLIESDCDVVIELIGGLEPARTLIKYALRLKRHVITANKALLAADGFALDNLAQQNGVTLRYSASVGGSLPALEAVARATRTSRPKAIKGIINGTCNFICDQLAAGNDLKSAVRKAQQEGFAEADPTLDLDGTDAAQKLILLARASFGEQLTLSSIHRTGISSLDPQRVNEARAAGKIYKLIAECRQTSNGLVASVKPVEIDEKHRFRTIAGAENCLLIETENGNKTFLRGRGAGRYATTESVMADLFDLSNTITREPSDSHIPPMPTPNNLARGAHP